MSIRKNIFTTILTALMLSMTMTPSLAQDDAEVRKDLGTVIALQGKPCGKVVSLRRQGDNDYLVTCSSSDRYRVYVDVNDRVIVEQRN